MGPATPRSAARTSPLLLSTSTSISRPISQGSMVSATLACVATRLRACTTSTAMRSTSGPLACMDGPEGGSRSPLHRVVPVMPHESQLPPTCREQRETGQSNSGRWSSGLRRAEADEGTEIEYAASAAGHEGGQRHPDQRHLRVVRRHELSQDAISSSVDPLDEPLHPRCRRLGVLREPECLQPFERAGVDRAPMR